METNLLTPMTGRVYVNLLESSVCNVNPGLINHGLLIVVVPSK